MDTQVFETTLLFLGIGAVFFAVSMIVMVMLFGLSMSETIKNTKGIVGLVIISLGVPIGVISVGQKVNIISKADSIISIENYSQIKLTDNEYLITLTTSDPAIVFMEYEDSVGVRKTILPTYSLEYKKDHSMIVLTSLIGEKSLVINVNGAEYEIN